MSSSCPVPTPSAPPPLSLPAPLHHSRPLFADACRSERSTPTSSATSSPCALWCAPLAAAALLTFYAHHVVAAPKQQPTKQQQSHSNRSRARATSSHWHASSRAPPTPSPHFISYFLGAYSHCIIVTSFAAIAATLAATKLTKRCAPNVHCVLLRLCMMPVARSSTTPSCLRPSALSARRIKLRARSQCR